MKQFKFENKMINFIESHLDLIFVIVMLIISLAIRYVSLPFISSDYETFLKPWFYYLQDGGGLKALGTFIGDYNAPYMTVMALLTYIKVDPLISIKVFSIIFDYILAFVMGMFVFEVTKNKSYSRICSLITLFIPTVLINSSLWGQCDVIYTTFIVLSLYYLYKNKMLLSFVFLGISMACKLQFIFILPAYIIYYFSKKDFSIINFLIVPLMNLLLCLPAIIFGKPLIECLTIYFKQTASYHHGLGLSLPNFYYIVSGEKDFFSSLGIILIILIFGLILYYIIKKKIKLNFEGMLILSVLSILICNYFLPYMHERYLIVGSILGILYAFIYKKNILEVVGIEFISFYACSSFLLKNNLLPTWLVSLLFFTIIVSYFRKFYKLVQKEVK